MLCRIPRRFFSTGPSDRARLSQLFRLLKDERKHLLAALAALGISTVGTLSFPFLTGKLMDSFSHLPGAQLTDENPSPKEKLISTVRENASFCILALGVAGLAGAARVFLLETASEKISKRLRVTLFGTLLRRPQSFFDKHRTGELVNRLGSDVTAVSRSVIDCFWGLRTGLNAILGSAMVVKTAPLSAVPQLAIPVGGIFLGGWLYGRFLRSLFKRKHDALAKATEHAEEKISMVKVVKLFNGQQTDINKYQSILDNVYDLASKAALASSGQVFFFTFFGGGFIVDVIYSCGVLITEGALTIGQTSALAGYLLLAGRGYQGLMGAYGDVQRALGAGGRVLDILEQDKAIKNEDPTRHPIIFNSPPAVLFNNVGFAYPTAPNINVLDSFTMNVQSGAKHAIVGPSGCGKSSVLLLLSKLYEPTSGIISLDGKDMSELDTETLRMQTAVVPQDSGLFADSAEGNVCYPHPPEEWTDREDLIRRSHLQFIRDWSASVGERGQSLSGGERQRLCIARALLKDAPLVLLDEATSALDRETDRKILDAFVSLKNKTVIAVTHKLSTVHWSDSMTVVENGRVVQEGDTQKLIREPGPVLQRLLSQISTKS